MMEFMGNVQLAELALTRGTADSVRALATYFIDDCDRVLLDIARIATRKNLALPKSLDHEHEIILQYMREKTGAEFDSEYMERTALYQSHALELFRRGQTIKIPEISAFASRVLAMTEARIKLIRKLFGRADSQLDGNGSAHSHAHANSSLSKGPDGDGR